MPINKPWAKFDEGLTSELPASLGIYEIADAQGECIFIGRAGGAARFGLRGEIADRFSDGEGNPVIQKRGALFRYETNSMYISRWVEHLILFKEEHGELPAGNQVNAGDLPHIGRFHWRPSTGQWQA